LHFAWWWLPALFLAFDASIAGYLAGNRAGAVCYNLAHAYVVPAVLLLSYVLTGTRWCAFAGLLWAFHIAGADLDMLVDMAYGVLYYRLLVGHAPLDEQAARSLAAELTRAPGFGVPTSPAR
jgi:hypothetical protein